MNKKLAVIGASYLQLPLVMKAKELGLEVHCFAWNEGAICKDFADYFYPISITEKELILKVCKDLVVDGVCTIASDVAAPTVAYIANKMNLVGNNYDAAVTANNKYLMRKAFTISGIPCPKFIMVNSESLRTVDIYNKIQDFQYPMIVKPSDRSGSLGVTKVTTPSSLYPAIEIAIDKSFMHQAMIEEFIEGREISVEFISYKGVHYPLQITDKVTTEAPNFVELEHHQPSAISDDMFATIYSVTKDALNALGLTNGASHAEYKITPDGRIYIIEIGGRMGGDFIGSDLVRLSTGYDFLKGVIDVSINEFKEPIKTINKCSGIYFLCKQTEHIKSAIENWTNYPSLVDGKIMENELREVKCSADRSGYVIYQADIKIDINDIIH
ncbi:MAG: ATP-grasp domain-containing protein [Paludibacteraceae bacterium]|nr:ATP-grasp domain-containing protein [Paludibacteraceae bacterium]